MKVNCKNKREEEVHKNVLSYMKEHNCSMEQSVNDLLSVSDSEERKIIYGLYDSINLPMEWYETD